MHTPYLTVETLRSLPGIIRTAIAMEQPVVVLLPYEYLAQAQREARGASSVTFYVE